MDAQLNVFMIDWRVSKLCIRNLKPSKWFKRSVLIQFCDVIYQDLGHRFILKIFSLISCGNGSVVVTISFSLMTINLLFPENPLVK